jgi:cytochrome c5
VGDAAKAAGDAATKAADSATQAVGDAAKATSDAAAKAADTATQAVGDAAKATGDVAAKAADATTAAATGAAAAVAGAAAGATGAVDGEKTYKGLCFSCHDMGIAGAPKLGDKAAWAPRVATGDALYVSALNGKNAMPAKGGNPALSEAEVKASVDWMVAQSK